MDSTWTDFIHVLFPHHGVEHPDQQTLVFIGVHYIWLYKKYIYFESGPHGRPPIGGWATLYKYQEKNKETNWKKKYQHRSHHTEMSRK